ncbi:hypothetical protein LSAT2_032820 [Lamellibrachia satsuma]|nr:hypothetical protein LSAT2_032820 [Lamellibrachia satsuma]
MQRRVGRRKLAIYLEWESFDEEENGQQSIRLDYLYDNVMFTIHKGFPWPQVCRLLSLANEMLKESFGLSLVETLKLFKKKSTDCLETVNEHNLSLYSDFFFRTFMQHYKLYQWVYLNQRQLSLNQITLTVETSPKQEPFTEAKPVTLWEYDKKVEAIKEELEQHKLEHEQYMENVLKEDEKRKKMLADRLNNIAVPMDRENILQIIQEVTEVNVIVASHQIEASLKRLINDFDLMFEPTAVPRPVALGPPPRFETKDTPSPTRSPSLGQKSRKSPKDKGYNSK